MKKWLQNKKDRVIREKYPETRFHVCGSYEQDYQEILAQELANTLECILTGALR